MKAIFSKPDYAASEFRAVLPARVRAHLDLDRLKLLSGSFVDEELRQKHTDLLYAAPLDDREAYIYLLMEHQSTVVPHLRLYEQHLG